MSVGSTVFNVPGNGWFETTDNSLSTSDPDNPYSPLTWTLTGNAGGFLNIEPTTGIIKLAKKVDRETLTSPVAINIIADDGSSAVTCTTTYTVTDENDNLPLFSPVVNYVASVVESVARGSAVALLQIDDKDDPTLGNSQVADGQLVLQTITDVNEEQIYFSPNVATDSITVQEDVCCSFEGNRTFTHTFTASDADFTHLGDHSQFTWLLTSGNGLKKFVLKQGENWNEARLLQVNDIDREELCGNFLCTGGEFELEIEVSDETDVQFNVIV